MAGADAVWEWPDSHRDLVETRRIGVLATVGPREMPQLTAVAYTVGDDGLLRFSVRADRQKTKNMSARPKATLFLMDPADTQRTVEVRATVEMTPDHGNAFSSQFATSSGATVGSSDGQPGRYVVTLHPERVIVRTSSGARAVSG